MNNKILYLTAAGNDGYLYEYSFNKNEEFKEGFLAFMKELGFKENDFRYTFQDYNEKKGENEELKIKNVNQTINNFKNKNFDVDVIFFNDKIILRIRTKKTKELIKLVNKYFKFPGEKKCQTKLR